MVCKEVIRKLSEYLDGELDPALAEQLTRHLEHCEDCQIIVNTTRRSLEIVCAAEPEPLPADVRARLNALLSSRLSG